MIKSVSRILVGLGVIIIGSQSVVAETYNYSGPTFTTVSGSYTTSMKVTGNIQTSSPIPANSTGLDITGIVTAFSFSDGLQTITNTSGVIHTGDGFRPSFNTNAGGTITSARFVVSNSPLATALAQTNNLIAAYATADQGTIGAVCLSTGSGGICSGYASPVEGVVGSSGSWSQAVAAQPVPAMSVWGLGILVGLLGFIGFRRRIK